MKYSIFCFIFTILFVSCKDVEMPEKPENLIAKDKMVDVLTEAYINNSARSIDLKKIREKGVHLDSLIYQKYKIDSVQFIKSNAYYSADLDEYIDLFKKVESKLAEMKSEESKLERLMENKMKVIQDTVQINENSPIIDVQSIESDSFELE